MANKHMKRCSASFVLMELQAKATMRHHCTPIWMVRIQKTTVSTAGKKAEKNNSLSLLWEMQRGIAPLEDSLTVSHKTKHRLTVRSSNCPPRYLNPNDLKTLFQTKKLHRYVYSSFICNCQKWEATKMSISRWVDKQAIVCYWGKGQL